MTDIIVIGLNTGISQEEIINPNWKNSDLRRMTIAATREKTVDTRTMPVNQTALAVLKQRSKVKSTSGYVLFNGANKRIDRWNLKSKFIEKFIFHTRLSQKGVDIYKIAKLLGHKDVTTTQRYAHHDSESIRSSVDLFLL